jgi:ADP-heptose:LPS heptosyltransferase
VEKIAVLRAGGIGDLVFALPALEALRAAYPDAELTLLGTTHHAALLDGRPSLVDRVVAVPPTEGINMRDGEPRDPGEVEAFLASMREEHFDIALQLHGGGRHSNPFVLALGARLTAGLRSRDAPPLDRSMSYHYWQPEVARLIEAVSLVGAEPVTITPRLVPTRRDIEESLEIVPESDTPFVLLNAGATDGRRRWPLESFAAAADAIADDSGAAILLNGSIAERVINRELASLMHRSSTDLSGRLSLGGLLALASRSALVISNDTGPLHLAAAAGAPTVGIYWCGNMISGGAALTRTRHHPCISWRLTCPVCDTPCLTSHCPHDASFVADVTVDEVVGAGREMMEEKGGEGELQKTGSGNCEGSGGRVQGAGTAGKQEAGSRNGS